MSRAVVTPARRRHRPRDHGRRRASCSTRSATSSSTSSSIGGASIDAHGTAAHRRGARRLPRAPTPCCSPPSAGPKWDTTDPDAPRPEQGLLGLRKGLGLFANLRPVRPSPALLDASPLKRERIEGTDLLVVRELTGGIYFGDRGRDGDTRLRHLRLHARARSSGSPAWRSSSRARKVTSVDKANVLETSRLWRETVDARGAPTSRRSPLEHMLVDNAAMQLVSRPADFDVILTENMFGDILSDEAAMLTGSLGMLPSASLGDSGAGPVRAGARLGARHRRHRHGQPAGDVRLGGADAAPRTRLWRTRRLPLESAIDRALEGGPPHSGPRRRRHHRGRHQGRPREPLGGQYVNTADLIWLNGEFVAWEDAKVHVLTHALHYGTGVFEGIRAYETERGTAIFRHQDHLDRLENSAKLYYMDLPFSKAELREATHELIVRNGFKSCYIRPLVYRGYGPMGLNPLDNPVEAMIAVWEWGAYLGEEGKRNGVRARVSSYRRISSDSLIPHSKACGQYLNSVLAKIEATQVRLRGGDPARRQGQRLRGHRRERLRHQGRRDPHPAADGRDPRRHQPQVGDPDRARPRPRGGGARHRPRRAGARRRGLPHRHRRRAHAAARDRRHRDRRRPPGPITREIQGVFDDALHGREPRYADWLDLVPVPSQA